MAGEKRSHWWIWPAVVGTLSGFGTLAAVFAGRFSSTPTIVGAALVATALTGFSTIYMVDRSQITGKASGADTASGPLDLLDPAVRPPTVLVSFHPADRAWARWIFRQLTECGYHVVSSPWPARPDLTFTVSADPARPHGGIDGEALVRQIAEQLKDPDCVLLLVSRAYTAARAEGHWWQKAMEDVLASGPLPDLRTQILPVLIEDCDVEPPISTRIAVDLTDTDPDSCREELISRLGLHHLPPPNPTAPTTRLTLPGRGPGISNVRASDATFIGRRDELKSLHALLYPKRGATPADGEAPAPASESAPEATHHNSVVVYGLGGVGKTELALQYAREFANDYDLIWWVQARTPVSAINDLIALAKMLDLPEHANHDEVVFTLWAALRQKDRWLLIFDDVDSPESIQKVYWPNTRHGHILVTSRASTGWESVTPHPLKLGELSPAESVDFLTRRIPEAVDDPEITRLVAQKLGHLPLALAQAATYVREAGTTLGGFHELLRDQYDEVIEASRRETNENAGGYSLMLLPAAQSRAPSAHDLLALLSMFDSSNIPRRMIEHHADILPEQLGAAMKNRLTNNHTVRELSRFSLIDVFTDRFTIHPVVQSTVRSAMTPEEQRNWSQVAIRLLYRAFPHYPEEPGSWSTCAFLMPHVQAATAIAERLGELDESAAHLLRLAGVYLHSRCDWTQAQVFLRSALDIRARLFGEDDLSVAECLYHLGQSQFPLAQLEEGRASVKRALEIRQGQLEPTHPLIADTLTHLAEIIREFATENDLAIAYTEQAERILREVGANEAGIADTLLVRGTILRNAGRLGEAMRAQLQSLALNGQVRANGASSIEAGANHTNIGIIHRDLGRWEQAREEFQSALAIMEPILGADHLEVAQVKKYLGDIHRRTGDLELAHELLDEVTEIHWRRPGEEHKLAACLTKLGSIELAVGNPERARTHLENARRIYIYAYGPHHPYLAKALSRLGPVYIALNQADLAEQTLTQAQQILESCYGPDYPGLTWVLQSLAEVNKQRGDAATAAAMLSRADRIRQHAAT